MLRSRPALQVPDVALHDRMGHCADAELCSIKQCSRAGKALLSVTETVLVL
jgi:hypothetical protein